MSVSDKKHVRLAVYLPSEAARQIEDLMRVLNVESRSAIIAQAVARWHSKEPLVRAYQERRQPKREEDET